MFKCRICGNEYDDLREVMSCEVKCLPNYEKKRLEKFNAELTEDMNKLNTYRQEYIRFVAKMKSKYKKSDLDKFAGLFSIDEGRIRILNKCEDYLTPEQEIAFRDIVKNLNKNNVEFKHLL